jgi:hypothetical protein
LRGSWDSAITDISFSVLLLLSFFSWHSDDIWHEISVVVSFCSNAFKDSLLIPISSDLVLTWSIFETSSGLRYFILF